MTTSPADATATPSRPARPGSATPSSIVYILQFTAVAIWVAYATVYFKALGIDLAVIGVLAAVPSAVAIVAAPAWGLVADRLGDMRPPYLVASVWAAGAALVLALGPAMPWLALVVVAVALGTSALTPLLDARTVQRLWPDRERFGQARAWGSVSFIVTTVVVGAVLGVIGLNAMFVLYAVALVVGGLLAYALLGRPEGALRVGGIGPLAALGLLRMPGLRLFFVGSVISWLASSMALTLLSLRVVDLGGGPEAVGLAWAVNASLEIPLMLLFPRLAKRVRLEVLIVVGLGVFALRAALWSVATTPAMLIAFAAISGIGFAFVYVGMTAYIASRVPGHLQATAQALFGSTAYAIGSIAGAILAGQIAQAAGIGAAYPASAVLGAVGAVLVWLAIGRRPPALEEAG